MFDHKRLWLKTDRLMRKWIHLINFFVIGTGENFTSSAFLYAKALLKRLYSIRKETAPCRANDFLLEESNMGNKNLLHSCFPCKFKHSPFDCRHSKWSMISQDSPSKVVSTVSIYTQKYFTLSSQVWYFSQTRHQKTISPYWKLSKDLAQLAHLKGQWVDVKCNNSPFGYPSSQLCRLVLSRCGSICP